MKKVWRVTFKSHRNSSRLYHVDADDKQSAFFVKAALDDCFWTIVSVEELEIGES